MMKEKEGKTGKNRKKTQLTNKKKRGSKRI